MQEECMEQSLLLLLIKYDVLNLFTGENNGYPVETEDRQNVKVNNVQDQHKS